MYIGGESDFEKCESDHSVVDNKWVADEKGPMQCTAYQVGSVWNEKEHMVCELIIIIHVLGNK